MQDLRTVKLTVISDLICPWCFIGHREIETAIAQCAALPLHFEIEYRPYRVNLSLNEDLSICRDTFFANKYGQEKLDCMKKIVGERGANLGINFQWGGKFSQTTRAHRLLYKAWQMGGQQLQQRLIVLLFKAHFEQREDIGDIEMLSDRAEQAGMFSKESALDFLDSDECLEEVTKMMQEARINGVTGVPFTVIDGKWAVSGGQSADVYVQIFQKLAASYIQEQTTPRPVQALPPVVCA